MLLRRRIEYRPFEGPAPRTRVKAVLRDSSADGQKCNS
jgi:hypothetical protein